MFTEHTLSRKSVGFHSIARFVARAVRKRIKLEKVRWQIRRERRVLRSLPDSLLRDIGVHRRHATIESERAYTDIPSSRLEQEDVRREIR